MLRIRKEHRRIHGLIRTRAVSGRPAGKITLLGLLLDSLLPRICPGCNTPLPIPSSSSLCSECRERIEPVTSPLCTRCGVPFVSKSGQDHLCSNCIQTPPAFDWARSIFLYEDPAASLIRDFKYRDSRASLRALLEISRPRLGRILESAPIDPTRSSDSLCVVPVPLHRRRLRKRTFNQSVLIAKGLFTGLPVSTNLVRRTVDTVPQSTLHRNERRSNVKGIFRVRSLGGFSDFLLIDDVMTTGSTLNELAKALKSKGARTVAALTLCRSQ